MSTKLSRTVLVTLAIFSLIITACSSRNDKIVGEWQLPAGSGGDMAFEFSKSGTVIMKQEGRNFSGNFKFKQDDQIEMTLSGDLGDRSFLLTDVSIAGDKLRFRINDGADIFEFVRVK